VSKIPDLHLWILGDGMLRPELERLTSDLGLTARVRFLGLKDDVASFMNAADLLVLSSDTEGIPGAILEAGLLGLPVVAPRVGGIEDCIVDGQTGLLTEPNDEDALSRAICKLSSDPVLRTQLGMRAQDFIQKNFLLQNIANEYVRFYQEVLNKNAASIRN